jgi:hypothetical protein
MTHFEISNPMGYPRAILARRKGAAEGRFELHHGAGDEMLMRSSGEYEWVRWVRMSYWDEEPGAPLDLPIPTPALPFGFTRRPEVAGNDPA